jgi:hypothetical protein
LPDRRADLTAFRWLWAAHTVSVFGSLVTRTALPFTAILVLRASPLDMALLSVMDLVAGFATSVLAAPSAPRSDVPARRPGEAPKSDAPARCACLPDGPRYLTR